MNKNYVKAIIHEWFYKWESGDFENLPVSEDFTHTSPFGTIEGKKQYFKVVSENKDKFLGYHFRINDEIYGQDKACVAYTAIQGDFELEVSEWYYIKDHKIEKINSYYHIGDIRKERKLKNT